ncbi:ankyrin repeat domain-containing protein [Streptomyces halstedii]|uniref:ankyrin repeat domain-containing protein n=1 Tax=Streptomyces halstedii TaxID=1944 RepID=UPI003665642E
MNNEPAGDAPSLVEALYEGESAVVRALRAGAPVEGRAGDGTTALYLAAVEDLPGTVRLLLAAGADPDRPSGPDAADLPLCGAVCGGHTEVVEALLSAGARPDLREGFGFTALRWAAGLGHARIAELLLTRGADPGLPGPEGEPPLVVAARRGSAGTVRALLRYGAPGLRQALEEAHRMLAVDVVAELRRALEALHGPGHPSVVRRTPVPGGVLVTVELLRDGVPFAGQDQETGHAAVATLLEEALGLVTPSEHLAVRALRGRDQGRDAWRESVRVLRLRGDEETFRAAAAWTASGDTLRRALGADVLARLGFRDGARPFRVRTLPLLRELARDAAHPVAAEAAARALRDHEAPASPP